MMVYLEQDEVDSWRQQWEDALAEPQPLEDRGPRWPLPWFYTQADAMALLAEPGAWVRFLTRRGKWRTGQVLARVRPGETAALYLTEQERRNCWGQMVTRHHDRVLILVPGERKRNIRGFHVLLNVHALCDHGIPLACAPEAASSRLLEPMEPGVVVGWRWYSSRGWVEHTGTVQGYLQAGLPLSGLLGRPAPAHLNEHSTQDRYLVRGLDGRLYGPAAHMVECRVAEATG
jgi:hypothetical protein